jgi:hypothetical protein
MHKQILNDFCQYQGIFISIFLIPLILFNILIPSIQLTTQIIEYNLCQSTFYPFFAFINVTLLLLKYYNFPYDKWQI